MARTKRSSSNAKRKHVTVTFDAPEARSVIVTGSFCDWAEDRHALKKDAQGVWKKRLTLTPGDYEYRFLVDGEWRNDPTCTKRVPNGLGSENCVLRV